MTITDWLLVAILIVLIVPHVGPLCRYLAANWRQFMKRRRARRQARRLRRQTWHKKHS